MKVAAAILAIGSEVLDGRIKETNSDFLADELSLLNIPVSKILRVGDNQQEIIKALQYLFADTRLVITTGGLGPTTDDLTREAIAEFFSTKLLTDAGTLQKLREIYLARKIDFPLSNTKQALYPAGGQILINNYGQAPGIRFERNNKYLIALPGVPAEAKGIFSDEVAPWLKIQFESASQQDAAFGFFGMPESAINDEIIKLKLTGIAPIYQVAFPETRLILRSSNQGLIDNLRQLIASHFRVENLFTAGHKSLPEVVHNLLLEKKLSLATAESCTGGMLTSLLTDFPGASEYLKGGIVTYADSAKQKLLEVPTQLLAEHGAVSSKTAEVMAQAVRKVFETDIGVSITGIAGPAGGSREKPVGTVYLAIADDHSTESLHIYYPGDRQRIRRYSAFVLLNKLRLMLEKRNS